MILPRARTCLAALTAVLLAASTLAACGGDDDADTTRDVGGDSATSDAADLTDTDSSGPDARPDTRSDAARDTDEADDTAEDAPVLPPEPDAPLPRVDAPADAEAVDALPIVGPFPSPVDLDRGAFMPRRITAVLADVPVGDLNSALEDLGAALASARPGDPVVTLEVDELADVEAAEALAERLVATGAFLDAFPAHAVALPLDAPADSAESKRDKRADGAGLIAAHEQLRLLGAWNADALRTDRVRVLVGDLWGQTTVPADLSTLQLEAGLTPDLGIGSSGTPRGNHGFWVAGLLGADVNGTATSGTAFRAPAQLRIDGFSVAGFAGFGEVNHAVERALRRTTGKVVVNLSIGYNDPRFAVDPKPRRALFALQWRNLLQRSRPDRVLVVAAAGNDGEVQGADASLSAPWTTQALIADLSTLVPSDAASQEAWRRVEAQATGLSSPRTVVGSTLVVGGAASSGERFRSSTPGADVLAPGELLTGPCVLAGGTCDGTEMIDNGTSGASPLAAGIAALAWGIAPDLSAADLRALLLAARFGALLDAYQVAVTASARAGKDIFDALADVDDDGVLDERDVRAARAAWTAAAATPGGAPRDWSRFDLNGDGLSSTDDAIAIDLDADGTVETSGLTRNVGEKEVAFDETAVTDLDILCIAAWGPSWTGDDDVRNEELGEDCGGDGTGPGPVVSQWQGTIEVTVTTTTSPSAEPCARQDSAESTQRLSATVTCSGSPIATCTAVTGTWSFDRTERSAGNWGSSPSYFLNPACNSDDDCSGASPNCVGAGMCGDIDPLEAAGNCGGCAVYIRSNTTITTSRSANLAEQTDLPVAMIGPRTTQGHVAEVFTPDSEGSQVTVTNLESRVEEGPDPFGRCNPPPPTETNTIELFGGGGSSRGFDVTVEARSIRGSGTLTEAPSGSNSSMTTTWNIDLRPSP